MNAEDASMAVAWGIKRRDTAWGIKRRDTAMKPSLPEMKVVPKRYRLLRKTLSAAFWNHTTNLLITRGLGGKMRDACFPLDVARHACMP